MLCVSVPELPTKSTPQRFSAARAHPGLGLVRHLAGVEHHWFAQVMAGLDSPRPFRSEQDRDAHFNDGLADLLRERIDGRIGQ